LNEGSTISAVTWAPANFASATPCETAFSASSDPSARLFAYRPDGTLIGEVQNGGGSRYGGTVMPYQSYDPGMVTIRMEYAGATGDRRMPVWPVNTWLFFSADDLRNSFAAELS